MRKLLLLVVLIIFTLSVLVAPAFGQAFSVDELGRNYKFPYYGGYNYGTGQFIDSDFLRVTYEELGAIGFSYESSINASTGMADHVPLSIRVHQGWNSSAPNQVNGTIYMSDGTSHTFGIQTYPVGIFSESTRMVFTLDGISGERTGLLQYDVAYIDFVLSTAMNNSSYLCLSPEPSDAAAYYISIPAVLSPIEWGVYITGYEITSNAPEDYWIHGHSITEVQEGVAVMYDYTGRFNEAQKYNLVNILNSGLTWIVENFAALLFVVDIVGFFILDPQNLVMAYIGFVALDAAYQLNKTKDIFKAGSRIIDDNIKFFTFILRFIEAVMGFIFYVAQILRSLWPF